MHSGFGGSQSSPASNLRLARNVDLEDLLWVKADEVQSSRELVVGGEFKGLLLLLHPVVATAGGCMALLNVRTCAPPSPTISLSKRTEYIILVDNTLQAQSPLCALTLLAVSCRIRVTFVSLPLSQCCTARNLLKSRALFCRVYYLYQFPSLSVADGFRNMFESCRYRCHWGGSLWAVI